VLEGLKVVELGVWVAGPSAGGLLADWGADVVKIEPPAGDPMRQMLSVIIGHGEAQSPPFDLDNRGKRSVVIDLHRETGREVALRLVEGADVFLTNLRPEAVDRLGLGSAALLGCNERLVYASVTGYGRSGPDAGRAGYDVGAFWARSGIAAATVPQDAAPPALRGGLGDHVTGLTTTSGILAALLERERTGRGRLVEVSLLRTGLYCLGWDLGLALRFGKVAPTHARTETINPMVNPYRAADDRWFWLLGVESQRHFPRLCEALGRPELATDERYATARDRRHHAAELIGELDSVFATRDRSHWEGLFDAHDVWWAPVNSVADVIDDPQVLAGGGFVDVPASAGAAAHRAVATPVDFPGYEPAIASGVPALGEHTDEVLLEVGYAPDELAALHDSGTVGIPPQPPPSSEIA
jgi:crotonobetainyl-CoA:carnitine CoA-transferase CaiB-like acyl-CoA transferase